MTIEVRQMLIKSTVHQRHGLEEGGGGSSQDLERMKEHILAECRRMILEVLGERRER